MRLWRKHRVFSGGVCCRFIAAHKRGVSINREKLLETILPLPVWDTHTHLNGNQLAARDFWEIGHYFWFLRELLAAGYPANYADLPENERIDAFLPAFAATRNTAMNWVVRRIFDQLYGVTISDAASIRRADQLIKQRAAEANWPARVCKQLSIQRIVVNEPPDAEFRDLPGISSIVPRVETQLVGWLKRLDEAIDARAIADEVLNEVSLLLESHKKAGAGGVMTSLEAFARIKGPTRISTGEAIAISDDPATCDMFLLHALCGAAEKHGLFLQFLTGIDAGWGGGRVPVNDPHRILRLYGLFERYQCTFELVLGTELNNLDAVQAAVIFPNVHVGGMWWYNFRNSTYRDSLQYRLEALPPSNSPIVVSDARCIEWCFGKVLLIKHLVADVLGDQVERGFLEPEDALRVAGEWLHGAAARRYR